jgi:hypothetical protein
MIQDDDYQDTNIKVLKFVEANDGEEFTKQKLSTPQETETKDKLQTKEGDSPCKYDQLDNEILKQKLKQNM